MKPGQVVSVDFGRGRSETLQGEVHGEVAPAIVVSEESWNVALDTVIVVPTTSSGFAAKRNNTRHVEILKLENPAFSVDCVAQVHLIAHVSKERVINQNLGQVHDDVLSELAVMLGRALRVVNLREA